MKKILLFTCCINAAVWANAQPIWFHWAKGMGGSSAHAYGKSIGVDNTGNVYTAGYFNGTVDFNPGAATSNLTSAGGNDIFISKLDASGNFIWVRQVGGVSEDAGPSLKIDGTGNICIAGSFQGTVDFDPGAGAFNLTSAGGHDIFILKLDASGNFMWVKRIGGASDDTPNSITSDASGNIYTTGGFQGTVDFDPGASTSNLTSAGLTDIYISKLDGSGNFVWAKKIGGISPDYARSIAVDGSGNVHVTGYFYDTVDFNPGPGTNNLTSPNGDANVFVLKLDASGNYVWAKGMGGNSADFVNGIALDASGNIFTGGYFNGTGDYDPGAGIFNLTPAGDWDIFISKLNSSGNFVWARQIGAANLDKTECISTDTAGNVYATGMFTGTVDFDPGAGTYNIASAFLQSIFILKLDASGNFSWANQIGNWHGYSINVDASNNVYTTGSFYNTVDFDPGSLTYYITAAGPDDVFVHKMSQCVPVATITPGGPTTFCNGGSVVLNANTGSGLTYQWQKDAITISGATSSNYTATVAGNYTVIVSTSCGSSTSAPVTVTVNPFPSVSITAGGPTNFCTGGSVTLTTTPGAGYSYQWKINGANISGATNQSHVASSTGSYTVTVTSGSCTVTSSPVQVTVGSYPSASITVYPAGATTIPPNDYVTLVANSGTGYTYQWKLNGSNITGATTGTYQASQAGSYSVVVTNSGCSATSSPVSFTICPSVVAPTWGPGPYPIQFAVGVGGSSNWNTNQCFGIFTPGLEKIVQFTLPCNGLYEMFIDHGFSNYTVQAKLGADQCNLSDYVCMTPTFVTSFLDKYILYSGSATTFLIDAGDALNQPFFTTIAPARPDIVIGEIKTSSVTVVDQLVIHQAVNFIEFGPAGFTPAQFADTANTGGTIVSGVTFPYHVLNGLQPLTTYDLYARSKCNGVFSYNSNKVTFTTPCVNTPVLSTNVNNFCAGGSATLTASGVTLNPGDTVKWYTSSCGGTFIGSGNSIVVTPAFSLSYFAKVVSPCGLSYCSNIFITVKSLPVATITPAGTTTFCSGGSVILNGNTGTGLTYQWKLNTVNISGATSSSYTATASGSYTVVVTNSNNCSNTSSSVSVTVNPLPTVSFSGLAASYNVSAPAATLTGSPSGGTFSGPGISGNTFTPSVAGVGGPYTIMYSYTDANGCSNSSSQQTTVTNCTVPAQPGTITVTGGTAKVCPGDSRTYTIAAVSGATSYTWTPPTGASISSGQGNTSVIINYTAGFTVSGTLSVVANSACGSSLAKTLTISRNNPSTPGVISGAASGVCAGTTGVYSVVNVAGITYNWTAPANASIASGQGTNSVTVSFSASFTTGTLKVTAGNNCGTSGARTLSILSKPATPSVISGASSAVCAGTTGTYTVTNVSGVTYNWTAPANASIASGQGTNSVSVSFSALFTSGSLKVSGSNACGTSALRTLSISSKPAQPGTITGPGFGNCNATATYSIVAVAYATSYTWTTNIAGAVVTPNGTSASISFPAFTSGTVSVTANNVCGSSTARTLTVKGTPATPASITGPTMVCANQFGVPYSIAAIQTATSYTWTGMAGSHISDGVVTSGGTTLTTTSTSVTVNFGSTSGNLNVKANNACGAGTNKTLTIGFNCRETEVGNAVDFDVKVFPNPSSGDFVFEIQNAENEKISINIYDVIGKLVLSEAIQNSQFTIRDPQLTTGIYSAEIILGENKKVLKLVKTE